MQHRQLWHFLLGQPLQASRAGAVMSGLLECNAIFLWQRVFRFPPLLLEVYQVRRGVHGRILFLPTLQPPGVILAPGHDCLEYACKIHEISSWTQVCMHEEMHVARHVMYILYKCMWYSSSSTPLSITSCDIATGKLNRAKQGRVHAICWFKILQGFHLLSYMAALYVAYICAHIHRLYIYIY